MQSNQMDKDVISALARQIGALLTQGRDEAPDDFALQVNESGLRASWQGQSLDLALPVRAGHMLDTLNRRVRLGIMENIPGFIAFGPFQVDVAHSLLTGGTKPQRLTDKESHILLALHQAGEAGLDKAGLLAHVWAYAPSVETHTLETHIYRLRQKIEDDPSAPRWLVNENGMYKLNS